MRLILLADGDVGLGITQYLLESYPDDLLLVVTIEKNEIYRVAESNGVAVTVFDSSAQVLASLPDGVDLGVLAWWPKIVRSPVLDVPRHGFVNTHPSLVPYNRGKHYNFWASGNNPRNAVREFLKIYPEFKIDKTTQHRLLITKAPEGYLKRDT